jgi:hypothetical protein
MKSFISFEIYVRDVPATKRLLERLFGASTEYADGDFADVWIGNSRIILNALNLSEFTPPNPILKERATDHLGCGLEIVVSTNDLEGVRRQAEVERLKEITPIVAQRWGLRDFRFLLADGYYVRVTEPDEKIKNTW